ncbi:MAG: PIN domain-containing protein [Desulfurococcales archaeon]|nr:PIN domain-containing protein [Desulfurococcales archaeon]
MSHLRKAYVLDASVLIEILAGSGVVKDLVDSIIIGDTDAYVTRLSLTEALYVTCRLWGQERALERMQTLIDSRTFTIIEDEKIWEHAANCKCQIPISLGDCYTLAAAKKYGITPLFLRAEREILRNKERIKEWLGKQPEYLITML